MINFFGICCANRNKDGGDADGNLLDGVRGTLISGGRPNTNRNLRHFNTFEELLSRAFKNTSTEDLMSTILVESIPKESAKKNKLGFQQQMLPRMAC
jgi:hypothetical protein